MSQKLCPGRLIQTEHMQFACNSGGLHGVICMRPCLMAMERVAQVCCETFPTDVGSWQAGPCPTGLILTFHMTLYLPSTLSCFKGSLMW